VSVAHTATAIAAIKHDHNRPWIAARFRLDTPGGGVLELESWDKILTLTGEDHDIWVPVYAAALILDLLEGDSLEAAFALVAGALPRDLPFIGEVASISIPLGGRDVLLILSEDLPRTGIMLCNTPEPTGKIRSVLVGVGIPGSNPRQEL
jgi:hypothetical protein